MRARQLQICRMQQIKFLRLSIFFSSLPQISADTFNLVNDTISLFRGLWVFTLVRIVPKLSTVLNTDVVPNQDPPDLV